MYVLALLHSFDKFVQDIFLPDKYVCVFPFASGTINELWLQNLLTPLSPLDSVESKQPLQSRLLNTPIFIPFWDGPLHPSKCRKKLILICFKALQLSLIPVLGSWHLFLQTSYFSSLTETLEWSIVLWLVNHSKSLNGQ